MLACLLFEHLSTHFVRYLCDLFTHMCASSGFYSVSRPGKYKLHVRLNDLHHIAGSPFDVEVLPCIDNS